jgi:hypothetical protein
MAQKISVVSITIAMLQESNKITWLFWLKELTVFALVYDLVRMGIRQSAALQYSSVDRISFLDVFGVT